MYGEYIYGVIIGAADTLPGIRGIGGASPVYTIAHQDLSCVVSRYSGKEFSSMSKAESARCLPAHQGVLEWVAKEHTVLPVQCGTVLANSDEVCSLLSQGHSQFFITLLWMQDKVEVEVVATWNEVSIGQHRDSYLERMISFLRPASVEIQPNFLGSDEMLVNVAFLVERANLEAFYSRFSRLSDLFYNQLKLHIIGPLPPSSFVTVEVIQPSTEKVEEARHFLGLGKVISELEVRKTYRRLTAEFNSDRRLVSKLARVKLAALRRSSDLLIAYCRSQAEADGKFWIYIRRSRSDEVQLPRLVEVGA
jgi:hypothetical protein